MTFRRPRSILTTVVTCFLFIPAAAAQTIWYVDAAACSGPGSGSQGGPFCKIQDALDAAAANAYPPDEINVANGIYTGAGNKNLNFGGKTIKLRSAGGQPTNCVIDCEGSGRGFYFHSGETAATVVEGLTIRNGSIDNTSLGGAHGGGVCCQDSSPTLSNCVISANTATTNAYSGALGGGVFSSGGSPALVNCTISDNVAATSAYFVKVLGGGVFCSGGSLTLTDCRINGNTTDGSGQEAGGGVCLDSGSSATLTNCEIRGNASQAGGGVHCYQSHATLNNCVIAENAAGSGGGVSCNDSDVTVADCTITQNHAACGGGVYNNWSFSLLTLQRCMITNNSSSFGGGIYCIYYDTTSLIDCTISGNTAVETGGGVNCIESSPTLKRCVISGNNVAGSSEAQGGGVYCDWDANPVFIDCLISENTISGSSSIAGGGGVSCSEASPTFINCAIRDNHAWDGASGGGIFCLWRSYPAFVNCSISLNRAHQGGGVYCDSGCNAALTNCTLTANIANGGGGGLYAYGSNPALTNCILWGDLPQEIPADHGAPTLTYCDVQGGWPGEGNINADPRFVQGLSPWPPWPLGISGGRDDDYGDLHLQADSPCIEGGSNAAVPADVLDLDGDGNTTEPLPFDIDGNPRFNRCCPLHITLPPPGHPMPPPPPPAVVDMGAYEFKLVLPEPEAVPIDRASSVKKAGAR